jgi:hypothetical protein
MASKELSDMRRAPRAMRSVLAGSSRVQRGFAGCEEFGGEAVEFAAPGEGLYR